MEFNRFGLFLVNNNAVDEEAIMDALNTQRKQSVPIGRIAIDEGLLSWKQTFEIMNRQLGTVKLFGEIAVDLGYLTEDDVQNLTKLQIKRRPRIGEILVHMKKIDAEVRDKMLERYHKEFPRQEDSKI